MKSYTDIEQSKKLAEILPPESADMALCSKIQPLMTDYISAKKKFSNAGEIPIDPCWSLAALLDYMHKVDLFPDIIDFNGEFKLVVSYVNEEEEKILGNVQTIISRNESFIDACVEMIVKLNEQNLL